ncbi:hypothetical protein ACRAWB_04690 [Leifsonia poae]|uniref:hypothetical protein n=1 Tax=Leifsonia poae TaxID=110933 RepID=UPI003D68FBD6
MKHVVRLVAAATASALTAAAVVSATALPASADTTGDTLVYDAKTGSVLTDPVGALRNGPGYSTYAAEVSAFSYTVKLVASPRIEQYRSTIQAVAAELNASGLASLTVAAGQFPRALPGDHEITVDADSTSLCGSTNLAGCGAPGVTRRAGSDSLNTSGRVWLFPVTDGYSAANKRHVVAHELGHALGLDHYADAYGGVTQVMHPSSYASSTFQTGDRNGFAFLARDFAPVGTIDAVTIPSPGTLRVRGWAFDPDQNAAATVQITVDGVQAAQRTTSIARPDVNSAYGLPASAGRGFEIDAPAAVGPHVVCARVLNFPGRTSHRSAPAPR